jgi:hypothetical protein
VLKTSIGPSTKARGDLKSAAYRLILEHFSFFRFHGILLCMRLGPVELTLIDGASSKTLRTETISASNNAWGAAYSFGGSDRSLPADMGQIVAEYLFTVVPAKK